MKFKQFNYFKYAYRMLFFLGVFSSTFLSVFAQPSLNGLQFNYGRKPSPILIKSFFHSPRFHRRVGGVDFDQVAVLSPSLQGRPISLVYNPSNPDGSRMEIWIDTKQVTTLSLPDWQLIPIVKFAATDYSSAVSIYGKAIHPDTTEIVYHPAFINTILGWRLLQADITLKYAEKMWHLPDSNGVFITGFGEIAPQIKDSVFYKSISSVINYSLAEGCQKDGPVDSWVFTDHDETVMIKEECNKLIIDGSPYYYFTYRDYNDYYTRVHKIVGNIDINSLDSQAKTVFNSIKSYESNWADEQENLQIIRDGYNKVKQSGRDTTESWQSAQKETRRIESKLEEIGAELYDFIQNNKSTLPSNNFLKELTPLSPVLERAFLSHLFKTAYPSLLQKLNPWVYEAARNTMQFSAFFRLVKAKYPESWSKFVNQVQQVSPSRYSCPTPYGFKKD